MIQIVELHYRRKTACDYAAIRARAAEILNSDVGSSNNDEPDKPCMIIHFQHMVQYKDGEAPAQTWILGADRSPQLEDYRAAIQQSRRCPNAEELLRACQETKLVTEMMSHGLAPEDRVSTFHGVLRAMIDVTEPDALVFKHTDQVVDPKDYLAACDQDPIRRPGSLNVRFFNISNTPGDMIMDTRGLAELGLHDLQSHFRDLDPQKVAGVLYNTALYIFDKGPVIESGQTVQGIHSGSKWRCQFEDSLLEPKREVLDLNPGPPHAAGNR
jgi:hypothetical protein